MSGERTSESVWDALSDSPAEAAEMRARSDLLIALGDRVKSWNVPPNTAADVLGLTRSELNNLVRGRISKFSLDALTSLTTRAELVSGPSADRTSAGSQPDARAERTVSDATYRRRLLAFSRPIPPELAGPFTTGDLAVLKVVGDEARASRRGGSMGPCTLALPAIAERASVSPATARRALRVAAEVGMLAIERPGSNLPALLRIMSDRWVSWLRRSHHDEVRS